MPKGDFTGFFEPENLLTKVPRSLHFSFMLIVLIPLLSDPNFPVSLVRIILPSVVFSYFTMTDTL